MSLTAILGRAILGRLLLGRGAEADSAAGGLPPDYGTAVGAAPLAVAASLGLSGSVGPGAGPSATATALGLSGTATAARPS